MLYEHLQQNLSAEFASDIKSLIIKSERATELLALYEKTGGMGYRPVISESVNGPVYKRCDFPNPPIRALSIKKAETVEEVSRNIIEGLTSLYAASSSNAVTAKLFDDLEAFRNLFLKTKCDQLGKQTSLAFSIYDEIYRQTGQNISGLSESEFNMLRFSVDDVINDPLVKDSEPDFHSLGKARSSIVKDGDESLFQQWVDQSLLIEDELRASNTIDVGVEAIHLAGRPQISNEEAEAFFNNNDHAKQIER